MERENALYAAAGRLRHWYQRWFGVGDRSAHARLRRQQAEFEVDALLADPRTKAECDCAFVAALLAARHWETLFFEADWQAHSKMEVVGCAKRYEKQVDTYLAEREAGQVQGTLF